MDITSYLTYLTVDILVRWQFVCECVILVAIFELTEGVTHGISLLPPLFLLLSPAEPVAIGGFLCLSKVEYIKNLPQLLRKSKKTVGYDVALPKKC